MLEDALNSLQQGELVAIPTDTTYGLVGDATNPQAVAELYALKARPAGQPSQVLVNSIQMAKSLAEFSSEATHITQEFWPGPLTLVLPFAADAPIDKAICGSRPTIGMRWPDHDQLCSLIDKLGRPLVASSVNVTGEMPLTTAKEIRENFPHLTVVEGEANRSASTIAELKENKLYLYREGSITEAQLQTFLP